MADFGLDDATLQLVVNLQLEDLDAIVQTSKGKQVEGTVTDAEAAVSVYKRELEALAIFLYDKAMALSISNAVEADEAAIVSFVAEEERAAADRQMALRLDSSAQEVPPTRIQVPRIQEVNDKLLGKLRSLNVNQRSDESTMAESSSSAAAKRRPTASARKRPCTGCGDQILFFDIATCPCGHEYCRGCLENLFRAAMRDETLFPPRCCRRRILLDDLRQFLSSRLITEFEEKSEEFATPNRLYCSARTCSAFIKPTNIKGDVATCLRCQAVTCVFCKQPSHDGDCPEDTATAEVLAVARRSGWQRCYSCRRVVELDYGCNHMTCFCGAQFCYLCGGRWKSCRCAQWNEDRLIARANTLVNRLPTPEQPRNRGERAGLINHARAHLIANPDCGHGNGRVSRGKIVAKTAVYLHTYSNVPVVMSECAIGVFTIGYKPGRDQSG